MSPKIEYIKIDSLHQYYDYNVLLRNNRLILVGENGTGKSTLITMLYYLMTLQWDSLAEYNFKFIEIKIQDRVFSFPKESIDEYINRKSQRAGVRYPREVSQEVERFLKINGISAETALSNVNEAFAAYSKQPRFGMPLQIFQEILINFQKILKENKHICAEYELFVNEHFPFTLIYLPTYRRIEKEIKKIFPHMEEQIRQRVERRPSKLGPQKQLELVEFGMEDVTKLIHEAMVNLSNHFRSGLEVLMGNYLREVLRETYETTNVFLLQKQDIDQIDLIFARIDEKILDKKDKVLLKERIGNIVDPNNITASDKIILHFVAKLYNLYKDQIEREKPVTKFLEVCNKYLVNKKIQYLTNSYELKVISETRNIPISLESLSSGEKQIVSIFAHLYLSANMRYFLIIDEPELSLSVPWQQNFLTDISNSDLCDGLVAVTHSPFIYDNDLVAFTCSINQFRTTRIDQ